MSNKISTIEILYIKNTIKGELLRAFFLFLFMQNIVLSQESPDWVLPPVTVNAPRLSEVVSRNFIHEYSLSRKDIAQMPVKSLSEAIHFMGGIISQPRGNASVQTDFSLRGTTFEQILVLVDGVPINDPQTGHHNSDLPVLLSDIERIDVLAGPSSAIYGSSGLGGVIHIHTKTGSNKKTSLSFHGGSHKTSNMSAMQRLSIKSSTHQLGFQTQRSDGYRAVTDYDIQMFTYGFRKTGLKSDVNASAGYSQKDFGANDFYASFPSREKTSSVFLRLTGRYLPSDKTQIQIRVYGKGHDDRFTLDHSNPQLYQSEHYTTLYGGEIQGNYQWNAHSRTTIGVDYRHEGIESRQLGDHQQNRTAGYCESAYLLGKKWVFHGGFRLIHGSEWGSVLNPTLQTVYRVNSKVKLHCATARVYRYPNFTEKYYASPANVGNPSLQPETGWIQEAGLTYTHILTRVNLTLFRRDEKNRIEWIRKENHMPWKAANITGDAVIGYSVHFKHQFYGVNFASAVTGLINADTKSNVYESKYAYNTLNVDLSLRCQFMLPYQISHTILVKYTDFEDAEKYSTLNFHFSKAVHKLFRINLDFYNVTNTSYESISGVPMPGFEWMAGGSYTLQ